MPSLRNHRAFRAFATFALALLALTLFAACDGGDKDIEPTATGPEATTEEGTRTPDESLTPASETGEAPIFWRTVDNFESLRVGEPYKVLFRITNGYEEDTLSVAAFLEGSDDELQFEANRAEPEGEEAPGSYYPAILELPQPGTWQVIVVAGDDEVTIAVQVGPAS